MRRLIGGISRYIRALGVIGGIVTAVGVLPFFVDDFTRFFFNADFQPPNWLRIAWLIGAFAVANLRVYMELEPSPVVRLALVPGRYELLYPGAAEPRRPDEEHPHLGRIGLPRFLMLDLQFEATNTSGEDCELVIDFDLDSSSLPALIAFGYRTRRSPSLAQMIAGGDQQRVRCSLHFVVTEQLDQFELAKSLKQLKRVNYNIVMHYHTIYSKGVSGRQTITIQGGFDHFCQALVHDWEQYGFDHLVRTYRWANEEPTRIL